MKKLLFLKNWPTQFPQIVRMFPQKNEKFHQFSDGIDDIAICLYSNRFKYFQIILNIYVFFSFDITIDRHTDLSESPSDYLFIVSQNI